MANRLSEAVNAEISKYFQEQSYSSKKDMIHRTRNQIEEMLSDSGFVYVSETGNVIHSKKFCGNAYGDPVHIEQAVKQGYRTLCKKCAIGTQGLSQILCKHRNAVQIEQNLFKAEVAQAAAALFSK